MDAEPIKWMALECIRVKKFTHQSDVWGFSVLLWELLSSGRTPYGNVGTTDVVDYIVSGRRLVKPVNCPGRLLVQYSE